MVMVEGPESRSHVPAIQALGEVMSNDEFWCGDGLPVDGQLRIVGRSTVLSTRVGRDLGRQLHPAPKIASEPNHK